MLLQTPVFTVTAIATLALGIAANTAIFSVVDTVLLKPYIYPDPSRIVMFENTFEGGRGGTASPTEFNWWRQQTAVFQDVSAYAFTVSNLTGDAFPEQIQTMRVSADFFHLSGVSTVHGRTFRADDDVPNAAKTAVLAYGFWKRRFAADPQVIGKRITLSGERYEVIGVAASNLNLGQISEMMLGSGDIEIDDPPDALIPFQLDPASSDRGHYFNVAGRLKPGITLALANAQLQSGYSDYIRQWPDDVRGRAGFRVEPLQDAIVSGTQKLLGILLGTVAFVLLIACANVANLQLARAIGRKREMSIRAAIGAPRWRIIRQLLAESVMLSLAGGFVGSVTGFAGVRILLNFSPGSIPRIGPGGSNVSLDWRVFGFALLLSIVTGILFGLVPALQWSRTDLSTALQQNDRRSGPDSGQQKTRAVLVMMQVALAVVLSIGAALLVRSFIAIRQVHPGFEAQNVLTMRMSLTGTQFEKPADVTRIVREALQHIRALPGVDTAAATCCMPLEDRLGGAFQIAGRAETTESHIVAGFSRVSPGYFETFRIPVRRGRAFVETDESGPSVAIISESIAKRFWPDSDPLNGELILGKYTDRIKIIGVVGDVRDNALDRPPRLNVYLLSAHLTDTAILQDMPWVWLIRTQMPPLVLSSAIQNELRQTTGGLPAAHVRTMEEVLPRSTAVQSFNALVLTIFGCSALMLAAIGIYGLMAYSVTQRVHEIGIRMALGAAPQQVRNMIVRQGLRLALSGIVCGLFASFALTRFVSGLLFGVKATDPFIFIAMPAVLLTVSLFAVWFPALRASRVDPLYALRYE